MKNKKIASKILFIAAVVIVVVIFVLIYFAGNEKKQKLKIGFIMSGEATEQGWNGLHYDGIKEACDELDIELIVKENIAEYSGQCEEAIKELASEDVEIIILSSYGYAEEVQEIVEDYPDITFYSESFDYYGGNLNCYFARGYQARYLAGIVAGMQTQTNCIGYVAAMPNSEVNRGINAFTLGVQLVNPDAKVIVAWSDSWNDSDEEKRLAQALIDNENVDVLTYHQNLPNVIEVAESNDIYSIGYHEPYANASDKFLTSVVFNWNYTYKELLGDYIKGKSDVINTYWFGLEKETIGLSDMSVVVSEDTKNEIETAKQRIIDGYDVFSGVIYDNEGNIRCNEGERISDDILMREMNWYVEGVEFYE